MRIHELAPKNPRTKARRIGRGGKRGTYSGKGMKGQKSRAGHKLPKDALRIISKFPKLRGVHNTATTIKIKPRALRLGTISARMGGETKITRETLHAKGIIRKPSDLVKIVSDGEVDRPLAVKGIAVSKEARRKIEAAGGSVEQALSHA